jgi:hypothetical protein
MSKNLAIGFAVGLVCLAVVIAAVFHMQRGAHIDLQAKFLKARTAPLDDNAAFAAIDFRLTNPSDYPFVANTVTVVMEDKSGKPIDGQTISEIDAKRVFDAIPLLGGKFNPSLVTHDNVPPHGTLDRMISARFEVPETALQARKRFIVRIEEIDGRATIEIPEH